MDHPRKLPAIRQTVILNASIDRVWKAVSTSEGIAAWFMPNDFRPEAGSTFTLQTPFGPSPCKVLELDPPHRLVFAWDTSGWRVTFELKEREEQTEFTLTHDGWGAPEEYLSKGRDTNQAIRDRMNRGWKEIVQVHLPKYVEG